MGSKKTTRTRSPRGNKDLVDPPQIKSFVTITVAYIISVSLLALLLGATFAAFVATPIWAFLYLVFFEWKRDVKRPAVADWRALLRFPKFNYLNIFCVVLAIFAINLALFGLFAFVDERMRPNFFYSTDDLSGTFELVEDPRTLIVLIFSAVVSFFAGGFIAGKIPNKKCPAPYRHGITAAIIWNLINFSLLIPLLSMSEEEFSLSEHIGYMLLATFPSYLLTAFGTWVAIRKRGISAAADSSIALSDKRATALTVFNGKGTHPLSRKKHGRGQSPTEPATIQEESTIPPAIPPRKALSSAVNWVRNRRVTITICLGVTCLLVLGFWAFVRKYPKPVRCENAPDTATLNFWPIGYTPDMPCHENAPVDARLVGTDYYYSRSLEEWQRGLIAKKGDEIYVRIYINNGALNNAEEINPGRGIARNVRLRTTIAPDSSEIHYVEVEFAGDNTNTVVSKFKIVTGERERIEVLPSSGEIFNYVRTEPTSKGLDVGNNTIVIGDLPPNQDASVYVRFRLRVIGV